MYTLGFSNSFFFTFPFHIPFLLNHHGNGNALLFMVVVVHCFSYSIYKCNTYNNNDWWCSTFSEFQQFFFYKITYLLLLCTSMNTTNATSVMSVNSSKPTPAEVWILGLTFVTVISLCAVFGILLMRCLKKELFNRLITFFVSIGVGSLSGSAVFHLLPHAFGLGHEHGPGDDHHGHGEDHHGHGEDHHGHGDDHHGHVSADDDLLNKTFAIVAGIYLFFFCDKFIKIVMEMRKRSIKRNGEIKQLDSVNAGTNNSKSEAGVGTKADNGNGTDEDLQQLQQFQTDTMSSDENSIEQRESERSIERQSHALCVHDHEYKEGDSVIATVAWMIIFGDGLHNFLDGVVIGASFTESLLRGVSISVAVLCEEFPHELGDVAILVNAGMTMKQALVYNLLSAFTCYVGFFIGVFIGNVAETSLAAYTHGFAGGMFLYISLACMMPEMKNAMEKALTVCVSKGLEVLGLQTLGVFTGLLCMFVMARYGESINFIE